MQVRTGELLDARERLPLRAAVLCEIEFGPGRQSGKRRGSSATAATAAALQRVLDKVLNVFASDASVRTGSTQLLKFDPEFARESPYRGTCMNHAVADRCGRRRRQRSLRPRGLCRGRS